ncbi:hypothetical protein [Nocardia sp. NPDC050793]|uniref:hypothetical protein n=1 Tax=Nocardia sp. NPDC050793 TaxID=3155159 RepID=UPI0033FB38E5
MLVALAVALGAAFVVAPRTLAASGSGGGFADERELREALGEAFVEYWASGARDFSPGLESVVDYWFRYHVAKAVIAAILLVVLVALGVLLWKAFLRAGGPEVGKRAVLATAGVLVTMCALFSLVLVMANFQGAAAPFSSLLPLLTGGGAEGELADTLDQIRQRLAESLSAGGQTPPPLEVMIGDFARYHVAMAVIAGTVAAVFIGVSVVMWKRFAGTGSGRTRRLLGSFGVLSVVLLLAVIVVVVANTTTAADPGPALLAFFEGGW